MITTKSIYGIQGEVCGVYLITCKINNKSYVGSSVDIAGRLSTHFGRECRLYPHKPLYQDITKFGRSNFTWEILEVCSKDELIEKEQHYFDLLNPEYNLIRPGDMSNIRDDECRKRMELSHKLNGEKLKELYAKEEYKQLFKEIHHSKFVPVYMISISTNEVIECFECMSDGARWLNEHTDFKSKNKVSKIRECCLGERKSAFGYKWEFVK